MCKYKPHQELVPWENKLEATISSLTPMAATAVRAAMVKFLCGVLFATQNTCRKDKHIHS